MSWALPEADGELLQLAKGYPYRAMGGSYLFRNDRLSSLGSGADPKGTSLFDGRVPVIAHGSNRSPDQLQRKFADFPASETEIPVTRAWLADHDVVYSAHVTQYGSIAANLRSAPGARIEIYVTWLTQAQLSFMHATELGGENYAYGSLSAIDLSLEEGPRRQLDRAYVYLSRRGCLGHDEQPIALAAVPAEGRRHGAMHQEEVLSLIRDRHRPDRDLDDHILQTIRQKAGRQSLIAEMRDAALPDLATQFESLLT